MARWSIHLFRIAGIKVELHVSFLLLLAYVAWEGASEDGGLTGALVAMALVLAFFSCVVLHELGHCLVAMRSGSVVRRILLMPIGGMAEFDSIPRSPLREILLALAGPAVNFLILGLLWPWVHFPDDILADAAYVGVDGFLLLLFLGNLAMGCFNLLPAFPMDGGRVLRALLSLWMPYLKATFWASLVGKVLALSVAALAIWIGHWMLALLMLFIFFVGEMEYRALKRSEALRRLLEQDLSA